MKIRKLGICAVAVALAGALLPTAAWAQADDESYMATEDEIAAALASGEIKSELPETDVLSSDNSGAQTMASGEYAIRTLYGETQYDTAACEALAAYTSSDYVIVASGESYVDALSATSLAGALDCPILLTSVDSLPSSTIDALERLNPENIIVVGGFRVVSDEVKNTLGSYGTVERLYGSTQFDTQLALYRYGEDLGLWTTGKAYVASGSLIEGRFADSLSASPAAFKEAAPVFLVDDDGSFDDTVAQALLDNTALTEVVVVGGSTVVSEKACGFLEALTLRNGGARNVMRIAGDTAYATSAAFAEWAVGQGILKWDDAAVATGQSPYDALAGSVVQGKLGSVLLLADVSDDSCMELLAKASPTTFKYFGGSYWFKNAFKTSWALEMGFSLSDIEGFVLYLDVGHGFNSSNNGVFDGGATGNGYIEYDLCNELAGKVADVLRSTYGMEVYVNNDGGYYALRQGEAYAMNCGALVSIHFNSGGGSGTESYIHSYNAAIGASVLQQRIHSSLVASVGLTDRGMHDAELAVCGGKLPATLLEIAFIDNANDMSVYHARMDAVAQGIAAGIAG